MSDIAPDHITLGASTGLAETIDLETTGISDGENQTGIETLSDSQLRLASGGYFEIESGASWETLFGHNFGVSISWQRIYAGVSEISGSGSSDNWSSAYGDRSLALAKLNFDLPRGLYSNLHNLQFSLSGIAGLDGEIADTNWLGGAELHITPASADGRKGLVPGMSARFLMGEQSVIASVGLEVKDWIAASKGSQL